MPCDMKNRDQRLDDFLFGKLSPNDAEAFEIHTFGCAECLGELRLREQMIALIKEERVTAVADDPAQRATKPLIGLVNTIFEFLPFRQQLWIYVGGFAILLIGFFATMFLRRSETPEIDAANFVELPHLESQAGQTFRSGEFSPSIFAPQIGENFIGDIEFRWEIKKDGEEFRGPVELKILNNREVILHTVTVANGQHVLEENLTPGLYYWTLSANNETLYIGNFFIHKPPR